MFDSKILFCLVALSSIFAVAYGQCNKCQKNGVACISKNEFYICADGQTPTVSLGKQKCTGAESCTADASVCKEVAAGATGVVCGDDADCGACSGTVNGFKCISKTSYEFCLKGATIGEGVCEGNEICSPELYKATENSEVRKICGSPAVLEALGFKQVCTGPTPSPTPSTPKPDPLELATACAQSEEGQEKLSYFYTHYPNDAECHSYLYCERGSNGLYNGVRLTCPNQGHWDKETRKCQRTKPDSCPTPSN